jgi:hypothetical protein
MKKGADYKVGTPPARPQGMGAQVDTGLYYLAHVKFTLTLWLVAMCFC